MSAVNQTSEHRIEYPYMIDLTKEHVEIFPH